MSATKDVSQGFAFKYSKQKEFKMFQWQEPLDEDMECAWIRGHYEDMRILKARESKAMRTVLSFSYDTPKLYRKNK